MPSGFLILGADGATGGGGVSSGWAFFLGTTMGPLSPAGPPESGLEVSGCWGCCGCGVGVDWAKRLGEIATISRQQGQSSGIGTELEGMCETTRSTIQTKHRNLADKKHTGWGESSANRAEL